MDPQPPQPTASSSTSPKIFCPYCGAQMRQGFQFCSECGRQLPTKKTGVSDQPSFQPPQPVSTVNPPPTTEMTLREVALTPSHKAAIQRMNKAPADMTRIFGVILGVGAIFVGLFDAGNTSLDPYSFATFVFVLGIFAVALSGASRSMRRQTNRVLTKGKIMELQGTAQENDAAAGDIGRFKNFRNKLVNVGGLNFIVPSKCLSLLSLGSQNKVTFATGDVYPGTNVQNVLFLSVNETGFGSALHGMMAAPGPVASGGWRSAKKRRM